MMMLSRLLRREDEVSSDTGPSKPRLRATRLVRFLPILIAVFLRLVAPASADNPYTFEGPESPLPEGAYASNGHVTVGTEGEVYYAFNSREFGEADVYFMKSADFGQTWSTPVKLDTDPLGQASSILQEIVCSPEGDVFVMFTDRRDGPTMRMNISHDRGETWLAEDIEMFGSPFCCSEGRLCLGQPGYVYAFSGNGVFGSTDNGHTWGFLTTFDIPWGGFSYDIDADALGNVYCTWSGHTCSDIEQDYCPVVAFSVSHDSGMTWAPRSLIIGRLDAAGTTPALSADENGHVYVAWRDHTSSVDVKIWVRSSDDYGDSFSPAVKLNSVDFGLNLYPQIASDCSGNVYVAWAGITTYVNVSHDFGQTWLTEPLSLDRGQGSTTLALTARDDGHAFASYASARPVRHVWLNYSRDGGRTFLANDVEVSERFSDTDGVFSDGQGHVYIDYFDVGLGPTSTFLRSGRADTGLRLTSGPSHQTSVVIPADGGPFSVMALIRNQTSTTTLSGALATLEVLRANGTILGTVATKSFSLAPGRAKLKLLTRNVPGVLRPGLYEWRLRVGPPVDDTAILCLWKE